MEQAAVAHVNLGRLYLALAEIFEPRRKLAHHEHSRHQIEVAPHGGFVDAKGAGGIGGVPNLSMVMRHHAPKTVQRRGGRAQSQLRQIAFEEGLQKLPSPREGVGITASRKREREAAPEPMAGLRAGAEIGEAEARQRHGFDAARKRFGGLPEQLRRRTAKQEETRRQRTAVRQHAQDRKQFGPALHLVDYDETFERTQRGLGFRETRQTGGILEIEVVRRIRRDEFAGERSLATLTWTQQRDNPAAAQRGADKGKVGRAGEHRPTRHHEIPAVDAGFSWSSPLQFRVGNPPNREREKLARSLCRSLLRPCRSIAKSLLRVRLRHVTRPALPWPTPRPTPSLAVNGREIVVLGLAALKRLELILDGKNRTASAKPSATPPPRFQPNRTPVPAPRAP